MTSLSLLEAAVGYARRGFYVFPLYGIGPDGRCECRQSGCKSAGKHPAPEALRGLHGATNDVERITEWWRAHPNRNIGLSLGPSGIGVVDVDVGEDKNGEQSLAKLEAKHGPLPISCEVRTGSGGRHIYFRANNFPTSANTYGEPNVDTRGLGGYVVAPPSRHVSGGSYRWVQHRDPESHPIAEAPGWLLNATANRNQAAGQHFGAGPSHIVKDPKTGLVVDGRRTFLRDITHALFWKLHDEGGTAPHADDLSAATWQRFSSEADLTDGRWQVQQAKRDARYIIKRFENGTLTTVSPTQSMVADVATYYKSPFRDGAGASERLEKGLRAFFKSFENFKAATEERDRIAASLEYLDNKSRNAEMRRVRAELHARFGRKCFQPPRLQIAAPAGVGKTSSFVESYAQFEFLRKLHIDYYVPTIARAKELESALRVALEASGYADDIAGVQVMYGRSDRNHGRCHPERKELVAAVEIKSRSVHKLLCTSLDTSGDRFPVEVECPLSKWCKTEGYQSQFMDKVPKLRIWPHAQLALQQTEELRLPDPDLVIVDESCVSTLCKSTPVTFSALADAQNYRDKDGAVDQSAPSTGALVARAVKREQGTLSVAPLIEAGLKPEDLEHAADAASIAASASALFLLADWPKDAILSKLQQHQFSAAGSVAGILRDIAKAISNGLATATSISLEFGSEAVAGFDTVEVFRLVRSARSQPTVPPSSALLLLDADADIEINRRLFDADLRNITIRAKRRGYNKQVYTAPYSTKTLTATSSVELRQRIERLIDQYVAAGKRVLVGCSLKVRRALTGEWDKKAPQSIPWRGASVTHFGAFVGSNEWANYDVVVVLGREQPPPNAVENIARALFPDEELNLPGSYTSEMRGYDLRSGERVGVEVMVHPDPRVQKVLDMQRERATGQLVDRLRLMFPDDRQPEIVVVSNLPIPGITVDELVTLEELLEGGSVWHLALAVQGGVLPLQTKYLSYNFMFSTLFSSERNISRSVSALHMEPWRRPAGSRIVHYRRAGSAGPASAALVSEDITDLAAQLAQRHGVTADEISLVSPQTKELCQAANSTTSGVTEFLRLSPAHEVGVVPKPRSKGSWVILGRQLGKTPNSLRVYYGTPEGRKLLEDGYTAPGSLWRTHLKGERYAVDVKLPGVPSGDQGAAEARLLVAGLDCSWIMPLEVEQASAKVVLFSPRPTAGSVTGEAVAERRGQRK